MEADSSSPTEMNLERGSEVSESSSVARQALPICNPTVVQCSALDNTGTTFANLKPLTCASSGDLHPGNRKLRSRPPSKKRRVDELEDTPSNHHSYSSGSSISSSFGYACDGFGDSARNSPVSEPPSHVPLLTGKEHCSEKEEEGLPTVSGVMETAMTVARSSTWGRIEEDTHSTAEKEFTEPCLSSSTQNSALQPTVTCSVPAEQDPQLSSFDTIPTESDCLAVSIPKETLGALWVALNANPVVEDMDVQENEVTMIHPISTANCLVLDGALERSSSSPLVISLPVHSSHSPPCCHTANESHGSDISSFTSLDSTVVPLAEVRHLHSCPSAMHSSHTNNIAVVSSDISLLQAADIGECAAPPSDVASSAFPSLLDKQSLLPVCQNHNCSKCGMTTDTGCDKTCATETGDGHSCSSCTNMEVDPHAHPAVFTAKVEMPNQAPLIECSGKHHQRMQCGGMILCRVVLVSLYIGKQ